MTVEEILTYVGTIVGSAVGALAIYMGWKRAPQQPTGDSDLMVHGQAAITDMAPIRDLLRTVDLLTTQLMAIAVKFDNHNELQARTAEALTGLAATLEDFVTEIRAREENREREAEIEKRAQEKAEDMVRDAQLEARGTPRKT